jgi:hypothetical protein
MAFAEVGRWKSFEISSSWKQTNLYEREALKNRHEKHRKFN